MDTLTPEIKQDFGKISQPSDTIQADKIETAKPITIPKAPISNTAKNVISNTAIPAEQVVDKTQATAQAQAQKDADELRNKISQNQSILSELGLGDIKASMDSLLQKGAFTQQLEDQSGIAGKTTALNEINSQIRKKDLDFRREREKIEQSSQSAAQKGVELAQVSREQARELADLSIIQATRNDDLATAQALVDRKVQLQFEPIQQQLEFQQALFSQNKELFTLAEQQQFTQKQAEKKAEMDKEMFKFQQFENTKLEYITNAKLNGAPNAVIQSILNSTDINKMITASGRYGYDPIAKANLANIYSQIGSRDAVKKGKIINLPELTGVPTTDIASIIDATGAKSTQSMTNATNVLASIQSFAQRNASGEFGGISPIRAPGFLLGDTARAEKQANIGDIEAINLKVQQWASGASLTEEQTKKVSRLVPENNDTDRQVRNKSNQLANFMVGQVQGELAGQGINYIPSKIDFFNQDPLGVGTPVGANDPLGIN